MMKKRSLKLSKILLSITCAICFALSAVCFLTNVPSKVVADSSTQTAHLTIEKTTFKTGEPILVSATSTTTGGTDWVGIISTEVQNKAVYWRYVDNNTSNLAQRGFGNGVKFDIKLSQFGGGTTAPYEDIPAGNYKIIYVLNDGSASSATESLSITVVDGSASTAHLSLTKTCFYEGEEILVTPTVATANAKDWVGVGTSNYKTEGSILWKYIDEDTSNATTGLGSGITVDVKSFYKPDVPALYQYRGLQAGNYKIYHVQNNQGANSSTEVIDITVYPKLTLKTAHLAIEKSVYYAGEPIMVTPTVATANAKDWIGISQNHSGGSIRWKYIDYVDPSNKDSLSNGDGNGVATDIRNAILVTSMKSYSKIPAGTYKITFGPNNCYGFDCSEILTITVLPATKPEKPTSATLALKNQTDGFFEGTVTVNCANYDSANEGSKPRAIEMKWADANGNALSGYSSLAKRKVNSSTTIINTYDGVIIPANAKKLLVYFTNYWGDYSDAFAITLPNGCQYKNNSKLISEFNVISDVHIKSEATQPMNRHWQKMLADVAVNMPNSSGIFVNGDIVDYGEQALYTFLIEKYQEAKQTYPNLPNIYAQMGNHELFLGSEHKYSDDYQAQLQLWRTNVSQINGGFTLPTNIPYYDMWVNGSHFIFLGSESSVDGRAHLSDTQLTWLKTKLDENRNGNPIYLFLHQGLSNTVAGTMTNQGWHGVCAGDEYLNSNDHSSSGLASREKKLRDIINDYPEINMFAGHSHWYFEAVQNILQQDGNPTFINTASNGYLWSDYDLAAGEYLEGSQGYYVRVYEDRVEYFGRNFNNATWASSAQFVVYQHTHSYEKDFNETKHFEICSCGDKINEQNHNVVNGACSCGYTVEVHEHDFTDHFEEFEDGHVGVCTCGESGIVEEHEYVNGTCICGKDEPTVTPPADDDNPSDSPSDGENENPTNKPNNGNQNNNQAVTTGCALGVTADNLSLMSIIAITLVALVLTKRLRKKNS